MPRYDYRCRACGATFEQSRPMNQSDDPATCPSGHRDSVKLLSTVALAGSAEGAAASAPAEDAGGGGCCGGGCCG